MQQPQDYMRELLFMLFARRRLIVLVTLLVSAISTAVFFLSPPVYQGTSSLLVRGKVVSGAVDSLTGEGNKVLPVRKEDLYSEVQLLSSTALIQRVAERLHHEGVLTEKPRQALVEYLRDSLRYEVLPATNVIKVSMTGQNREELVKLIDTTLDEYVLYRLAVYQPAKSLAFFERQANRLQEEIARQEQELVSLVASSNTPEPIREIEANLLIKRDLEMELNKVNGRLIELRGSREGLAGLVDLDAIPALQLDTPELTALLKHHVELQLARAELLRTYKPGSEKLREISREMAESERLIRSSMARYLSSMDSEIATLEQKEHALRERIDALGRRNLVLQESDIKANRIRKELAIKQTAYENFVRRRDEARMTETLDHNKLSSYVTVMEQAWSSPDPVFPRPVMLPLGLVTGLILGMVLALMREFFDHSFKKPTDLERISQMPVIGSVPILPTVRLSEAS